MSSIGRITGSAIVGHNENTLALANLNFDFTLFKIEAPKEFHGLGSALSLLRKNVAETGSAHQTARKLGALFEQITVPADDLYSAYGKRVSEISTASSNNPLGTRAEGAFQSRVGADGTAIWAAATSGKSAMAVNLLACMLARLWTGPEATSIWVELVYERKREIRQRYDGSEPSHLAPLASSDQQITRKELAEWDAHARAWLGIADEAKKLEQKQMQLIFANLSLPVGHSSIVYRSVTAAWKSAMTTMDNLIKGMPQRVQNGAILLALSAWHIYPDMEVFGRATKYVCQKDPLVRAGGRLTVGLENADPSEGNGVYWSLSLAHLRFYGDPVLASRSAGNDASRVSFEDFTLAVLGSFLAGWQRHGPDVSPAAQLLVSLWDYFEEVAGQPEDRSLCEAKVMAQKLVVSSSTWLSVLVRAARALFESQKDDRDRAMMLVKAGLRRGSSFLGPTVEQPKPVFGLTTPTTCFSLIPNDETKIEILRSLAKRRVPEGAQAVIRYRDSQSGWFEYATVFPTMRPSLKRSIDGEERRVPKHVRWISFDYNLDGSRSFCSKRCTKSCPCWRLGLPCGSACHGTYKTLGNRENDGVGDSRTRKTFLEEKGEECELFDETHLKVESDGFRILWYNPPTALCPPASVTPGKDNESDLVSPYASKGNISSGGPFQVSHAPDSEPKDDRLSDDVASSWIEWEEAIVGLDKFSDERTTSFDYLIGDPETFAVFISNPNEPDTGKVNELSEFTISELVDILRLGAFRADMLISYLHDVWTLGHDSMRTVGNGNFIRSLRAFASAASVYKLLPGSHVALSSIGRTLTASHWVTYQNVGVNVGLEPFNRNRFHPFKLDRARTFACVAMFETGTLDITPESLTDVMAMSSGNSIFAAAPILSDPAEFPNEYELRRIVGNIGRAGLAMLIPPDCPRVRKPGYDTWNVINHKKYDGSSLDCFEHTSMHLSFTGYEQPVMSTVSHGAQDTEAYFIESLISVYDRGKWVADLDILSDLEDIDFHRAPARSCTQCGSSQKPSFPATAIDSWDELLERPNGVGIVRAHGNSLARLATAAACMQAGYPTIVLPQDVCWKCLEEKYFEHTETGNQPGMFIQ